MEIISRWFRRAGTLVTAVVTGLLIPAAAWAQPVTDTGAAPLAKGKAVAGGLSVLCCLAVVAITVVTIVMLARRRRR